MHNLLSTFHSDKSILYFSLTILQACQACQGRWCRRIFCTLHPPHRRILAGRTWCACSSWSTTDVKEEEKTLKCSVLSKETCQLLFKKKLYWGSKVYWPCGSLFLPRVTAWYPNTIEQEQQEGKRVPDGHGQSFGSWPWQKKAILDSRKIGK